MISYVQPVETWGLKLGFVAMHIRGGKSHVNELKTIESHKNMRVDLESRKL